MISPAQNRPDERDGDPDGTSSGQEMLFPKRFSTKFRESWRRFAKSRPGRRFQDRYAYRKSMRRQRSRRLIRSNWFRKFDLARFLYLGGGLILIALSTVGGWLPVLGWGTVFLGLGLIAGEFKPAAQVMDWGEKRGRKLFRPVWHLYLTFPRWLQYIIPLFIALGMFALAIRVLHITFFGG